MSIISYHNIILPQLVSQPRITILLQPKLFHRLRTESSLVCIPGDLDLHLSQYPSPDTTKVQLELKTFVIFQFWCLDILTRSQFLNGLCGPFISYLVVETVLQYCVKGRSEKYQIHTWSQQNLGGPGCSRAEWLALYLFTGSLDLYS